jgi:hypothetical protein
MQVPDWEIADNIKRYKEMLRHNLILSDSGDEMSDTIKAANSSVHRSRHSTIKHVDLDKPQTRFDFIIC